MFDDGMTPAEARSEEKYAAETIFASIDCADSLAHHVT
jgi:hypothetical protein